MVDTTLSLSRIVKLRVQLAKNKFEIKHNKIITMDEFLTIITDKYEKLEL
jgi:hypothetical protein